MLVAALVAVVGGCSGPGGERVGGSAQLLTGEWVRVGRDLDNHRAAVGERAVGPENVAQLQPGWDLTGVKGVTGTPVVDDGVAYVGDWTGNLRALDAATGEERWAHQVGSGYVGAAAVLDASRVYVGGFEARVAALDRATGQPVWETRVDEHANAVVFGSPIVVDDLLVMGVASYEVFVETETPTFRGSVVALDAATGEEVWRFWVTAGDETEGPGVSIWSTPTIDLLRGHLYIGTGQAYRQPAPPRSDALLALDLETGEEVWHTQFTAGDAWTRSQPTGLDADVGAQPNLLQVDGTAAVGVGDKAGTYRALNRDTGEVLWEHRLSEGGLQGGVMASAAVRDDRVYVTSNHASTNADLVALDEDTGDEVWRVPVGGHVTGPVTWANGVLYLGDDSGRISGFAADDGELLWSHQVPAPAAGGISVVDGTVYGGWGWWLSSEPADPQGGLTAFRLGGGGGTTTTTTQPPPDTTDPAALGEQVYSQSCATCHGGSGEGGSGPSLIGVDERLTRDEHLRIVREGAEGMPAWEGTLTPEEIEAVVDYERTVLANPS